MPDTLVAPDYNNQLYNALYVIWSHDHIVTVKEFCTSFQRTPKALPFYPTLELYLELVMFQSIIFKVPRWLCIQPEGRIYKRINLYLSYGEPVVHFCLQYSASVHCSFRWSFIQNWFCIGYDSEIATWVRQSFSSSRFCSKNILRIQSISWIQYRESIHDQSVPLHP